MTDHQKAAFDGASSLPTPEQIAAKPWRYPQGRIEPEEDELAELYLSAPEKLLVVGVWCASAAAAISVLWWVFA